MFQIQTFTFNPFQENTYLLYNENSEAVVIDAGAYFPEELDKLNQFIREKNLLVKYLLCTHTHLDHIFAAKAIAGKYNAALHFHKDDEPVFKRGKQMGEAYGFPFEMYEGIIRYLNDGDTVSLREDELKVILAPGHSPGSVCFYCAKQKFVVSGDVLFYESIGRSDFEGGNHKQLLQSIREKLFTLPDDVAVYSGHGKPTTIGYEKIHNPFLQ